MIRLGDPGRARWRTASRVLAATVGAYVLTSFATVALSLVMVTCGIDRVQAVTSATLASFAIFAVIAITTFHARSAARAWIWLAGMALPLALLCGLLMHGRMP